MQQYEINLIEDQLKQVENTLIEKLEKKSEEERVLRYMDEARILLESVKTAKVKTKKDFILNIINTALNDIFDSDIRIDIHSSDEDSDAIAGKKLKMRYDIILYENNIEIGRNDKLLSSMVVACYQLYQF